jgi:hypothetical protein
MMDDAVAAVLARSFHRVRAQEANEAMARMRVEHGVDGPATSYELILPPQGGAQHLVDRVLPRLVYFLECRGSRLPHCAGVFVSIFAGEELYFVHAADLVEELSRLSGLSLEEMVQKYGG